MITLSIVLILTAAVLTAKAWVGSGGQIAVTAASAPSALEGELSSTLPQTHGEPAPVISFPTDGRPALLFFNGKHGCRCEMREYEDADRSFASVPEDLLAKFVVAKVDIHEARDVVHEYRVMFPPAVILLDSEGREMYRREYGVYGPTLMEEMAGLLIKDAEAGR